MRGHSENSAKGFRALDAHCHLSDSAFDFMRDELYGELISQNITGLVLAGTVPADWVKQKNLDPPPPLRIARVFGIHPWFVDTLDDHELHSALDTLKQTIEHCQGLGEIGLDYFRAKTENQRTTQKKWFEAQLDLAKGLDYPLVLHVVKAHHESVPTLRRHGKSYRGLIHSYWAHVDVAKSYIDMGFLLSVPPRIMKEDPHQILARIDPEHIVFETDTPFQNALGETMQPTLIHEFLENIAHLRGEPVVETAARQERLLSELFPILKEL
ncbi:MAG: TatD family hydrolase [Chitinophagaceae bacterium]|nr:TatD family hydrolase [Oligoflexus sp.]